MTKRIRRDSTVLVVAFLLVLGAALLRPNAQGKAPLDGSQVQLTAAAVRQDLDIFQNELEQRFSYLRATNVDYRAAIERIAAGASQGLTVQQLGIELQQIISLFIDGHAEISGFAYPVGYLPFLLDISGERVVGFHADRSALLDPARPYVAALDGRPLQDWLRAAERHAPQGSPQYRRFRALRFLRNLQFMRGELGLPVRNEVTVEVVAPDGRDARSLSLPVASQTPRYGHWPMRGSQLLDGNIGYLRLPQMTEDVSDLIDEWMHYFKETRGLIVDVRSNSGGWRVATRAFFPYLLAPDDEPRVTNVAAYRLYDGFQSNHLEAGDYGLYPQASPRWTKEERAAIARLAATWTPEWHPPTGQFSEWHYQVLSRRLNPRAYFYSNSVVVLIDDGVFSAADIFVTSLKGWRDVTLVGTPTRGGSAKTQTSTLPHSKLVVSIGSMVSFTRNGELLDGRGTLPDIHVDRTPESFLRTGRDNQLERAIAVILRR